MNIRKFDFLLYPKDGKSIQTSNNRKLKDTGKRKRKDI